MVGIIFPPYWQNLNKFGTGSMSTMADLLDLVANTPKGSPTNGELSTSTTVFLHLKPSLALHTTLWIAIDL